MRKIVLRLLTILIFTLLVAPKATAQDQTRETQNTDAENHPPSQIAQSFNLCPDPQGDIIPFVWAETKDFLVNICYYLDGNGLGTYYGRPKNGGKGINVPLQNSSESPSSGKYVAVKGDTTYILTLKELVVLQNRKTILRQKVFRFRLENVPVELTH